MLLQNIDAATDNPRYEWSSKTLRYRDNATGKFISRQTANELSRQRIELLKTDLTTISQLLIDNKINLKTWQLETANALKILHSQQYVLGKGGLSQIRKEDYLAIGRELKIQYKYLRNFANDINNGNLTEGQFKARSRMYADAAIVSYHRGAAAAARRAGYSHAKRILGIAEHCNDCLRYFSRGIVPLSELILPTQRCACRARCKCSVRYLTREEILKGI